MEPHAERRAEARLWLEFVDPDEPAQRFRCDLTWLTSGYACIFGRGCHGLNSERPDDGCCGLGAHFCDEDDVNRVAAVVDRLTSKDWQFADEFGAAAGGGADRAWTEIEDDATKTAVVDGACVLLNRADFPGGAGCALHALAITEDVSPVRYKPDVCWQLPIYRDYRTVELADGSSYLEITIGEYERGRWGPGGHDFDWYCSAAPEAHGHREPLFRSHADELTELMGAAGYAELARRAEAHLASVDALAHGDRRLLPLFVHPATLASAGRRPHKRTPPPRHSGHPGRRS